MWFTLNYQRRIKLIESLEKLNEKSKEILSEARKLIDQSAYSRNSSLSFNELFLMYKDIELQKELCNQMLIINEVIDENTLSP